MTQSTNPAPPPAPETVNLTINGRQVSARKGTLLVEAAKQVGIEIPVFCYHPKLKSVGACRMCLVQIEKLPRLQTACTTPVAADMVVHTGTPEVIAAQNGVIEFLLANHPLDCPICDKGGECPLQDNSFNYGLGNSRFTEQKRHKDKAYPLGPRIVLDRERCIMCYRCVRFHQEIPGDEALAAVERGVDSEIDTLRGEPYDSIFSGNTIEICPVGALTSAQYRFKARPWDLVRTPSVCNGCSVGCNIEVHSRTETVLRLVARENPAVDDGWLCDRGRFETVPVPQLDRPARPLVRQDGALREASWQVALGRAAELLGNGNGGVLASAGLSSEALWLLEQLAPTLGGTVWPWPGGSAGGDWPAQGAIANLSRCKRIVLVGLDVWYELPVLALWINRAVSAGARLVVLGEANGLWRQTTHWLKGDPAALIEPFTRALGGAADGSVAPELKAAAEALRGAADGPAALLAHPALVPSQLASLQALAVALGASPETGLVGAPQLGANARGAQELAPSLARGQLADVLQRQALLVIGDEPWAELDTGAARLVLATSGAVADEQRLDVVLPMAHPYERQGSLINLEGRLQKQEGGAAPLALARTDWGIVAELATRLGQQLPQDLPAIRARLAEQQPRLADALQSEVLVARV